VLERRVVRHLWEPREDVVRHAFDPTREHSGDWTRFPPGTRYCTPEPG
jgi:hypothetical protein